MIGACMEDETVSDATIEPLLCLDSFDPVELSELAILPISSKPSTYKLL